MSDERQERCETCRFWERIQIGRLREFEHGALCHDGKPEDDPSIVLVGRCLRYPPFLSDMAMKETIDDLRRYHDLGACIDWEWVIESGSINPTTWEFDWCGEWQPKPEAPS